VRKNDSKKSVFQQLGSVLTEYLITTSVITVMLFVPIPGLGVSAIDLMIIALNEFQNQSTVLLSMP